MTFLSRTRTRTRIASGAVVLAATGGLAFAATASADTQPVGSTGCSVFATESNAGQGVSGGLNCGTTGTWTSCEQQLENGTWVTLTGTCQGGSSDEGYTSVGGGSPAGTYRVFTVATVDGQQATAISAAW